MCDKVDVTEMLNQDDDSPSITYYHKYTLKTGAINSDPKFASYITRKNYEVQPERSMEYEKAMREKRYMYERPSFNTNEYRRNERRRREFFGLEFQHPSTYRIWEEMEVVEKVEEIEQTQELTHPPVPNVPSWDLDF
ncbi:hypothetical protein HZS_4467 [Henneguya salminicola]|nr:hypothetical protein HZS_4467 [Henneguya salminicola]